MLLSHTRERCADLMFGKLHSFGHTKLGQKESLNCWLAASYILYPSTRVGIKLLVQCLNSPGRFMCTTFLGYLRLSKGCCCSSI